MILAEIPNFNIKCRLFKTFRCILLSILPLKHTKTANGVVELGVFSFLSFFCFLFDACKDLICMFVTALENLVTKIQCKFFNEYLLNDLIKKEKSKYEKKYQH